MAKKRGVCKVCGKQYYVCTTEKKDPRVFRWQDVACSPECGAVYLKQVTESRQQAKNQRPG